MILQVLRGEAHETKKDKQKKKKNIYIYMYIYIYIYVFFFFLRWCTRATTYTWSPPYDHLAWNRQLVVVVQQPLPNVFRTKISSQLPKERFAIVREIHMVTLRSHGKIFKKFLRREDPTQWEPNKWLSYTTVKKIYIYIPTYCKKKNIYIYIYINIYICIYIIVKQYNTTKARHNT